MGGDTNLEKVTFWSGLHVGLVVIMVAALVPVRSGKEGSSRDMRMARARRPMHSGEGLSEEGVIGRRSGAIHWD